MRESDIEHARDWLTKAEHDLWMVEWGQTNPDYPPDVASYLSQQAAEKSLKALLVAEGEEVPKTHDLSELTSTCAEYLPELPTESLEALSKYAVGARYPGLGLDLTQEEAASASRLARSTYEMVREHVDEQDEGTE